MKAIAVVLFILAVMPGLSHARESACIARSEMGETATGEHLYERDADLKTTSLSRIDFDLLTVTSAEGKRSSIMKVADNIYRSADPGGKFQYHYITNSTRSIVAELSVSETATYIKVLVCK